METKDKFSVDNLDVAGILDAAAITEADIMAGKYDFAEIEIFMVNVTDLTQGSVTHRRGWLGEVSLKNGQFVAEVRGLAQKLQQNIVELYSPTCRAVFGDGRCKVNLASYTVGGTVNTITSRQVFISNSMTQAAGYFSGGEIRWLTGANAGRRMEIKEFANVRILVDRTLTSSTTPSLSPMITQSPILNGRSRKMITDPNKFLMVSCAASANASVPNATPPTRAVIFTCNMLRM